MTYVEFTYPAPSCGHVITSPSFYWVCTVPPHEDDKHWMERDPHIDLRVRTHAH